MKIFSNFRMFVLTGCMIGLGACQTTSENSAASGGLDTSSLSSGAKMIADASLNDMSALKKACEGGREGVTALIRAQTTNLMQSGENLDPGKDGPEAGSFIGNNCQTILSS